MVLTCNHETKIISRTTSAFTDPKLRTTALYNAFGKNEELLSKSLAYIYASCQRNKLVHPCLLPSLVLHSVKVTNKVREARSLFCFLKQVFRIEFIFDPDKTGEQVNIGFYFSHSLPALNKIASDFFSPWALSSKPPPNRKLMEAFRNWKWVRLSNQDFHSRSAKLYPEIICSWGEKGCNF